MKAFRIRPNAGEAHLARAHHLYNGYLDYDGALAELEVGRQSSPNDPRIFAVMGFIQRRQGRWEESMRNFQRAIELDPRSLNTLGNIADSYANARRYAEQKSTLDRSRLSRQTMSRQRQRAHGWKWIRKADTGPSHQVINEIRTTNPASMPQLAGLSLLCALAERDVAAAKDALLASDEFPLGRQAVNFTRPFVEGVIARMTNDEQNAQLAFAAAREKQEKTFRLNQITALHGACWV